MPRKIKIDVDTGESKKAKKPDIKKRNWAFVLYPESAPEDWTDILTQTGLPCAISPLHDKDVDPTGETKKAHYHVILMYSGPVTFSNVRHLTDSLNQPIPQPLDSVRGYYRYLTHKDNPDKYQYNDKDIICLNGFNYLDFLELTTSEIDEVIRELMKFIRDTNITEYSEFMDFLDEADSPTYFRVARTNTIFFTRYITSRRHSNYYNSGGVSDDDII